MLRIATRYPIRLRVAMSIALAIVVVGWALIAWTQRAHRQSGIEQARHFAESVQQLTLAGLTAMMITGEAEHRDIFLDQIQHSSDIRSLRVVRSFAVARQFGPGAAREQATDQAELQVLASGAPHFEVLEDGGGEYLKAVMPAVAKRSYLGKDCLGCHDVAEGTVLGAVSVEISLARIQASIDDFRREAVSAGFLLLVAVTALSYFAVSRSVSVPLLQIARRLRGVASGRIEQGERLRARGHDEIATVVAAFDEVLAKAQRTLSAERIAGDVFEHALEAIIVTDAEGRILRVNPAFTRTTGYSAEEALGQNPRILQSGLHDGTFYREFWQSIRARGEWQGDIWNRRKDGELYAQRLNISRVCDENGVVQNYVALFSDITERMRAEVAMRHRATHDTLTGLPNRALLRDRLEQALTLARRQHHRAAVMFLDLDRFKHVNDTMGHEVGDELLRQVAARIQAVVRESDTVARVGGDEFVVLLPEVAEPEDARAVGDKILQATRLPYLAHGLELVVTTSVGVSLYPDHGEDAETLLKQADVAMYQVKGAGRAGCRVYDPMLAAGDAPGAGAFG